jgi:NAD(P)H-dependent FMN reductase
MGDTVRILALAGSTREASLNKKLVRVAADGAASAGAETTFLDLRDYPLPLYDEDIETRDGAPAALAELKAIFKAHQGLLIAAPEYNGSIPAVLKNAIDWLTRKAPDEPFLAAFDGKVAGLLSASPGALGGLRGLAHLQQILSGIRVTVVPDQHAVPRAPSVFDAEGRLLDEAHVAAAHRVGARVADFTRRLTLPL